MGGGKGARAGFYFPRKLIQQFKGVASRSIFNQPLRLFWSKASADHFVKGFIWSPKWIISSSLSSGAWGPGEKDTLLWWYDQCSNESPNGKEERVLCLGECQLEDITQKRRKGLLGMEIAFTRPQLWEDIKDQGTVSSSGCWEGEGHAKDGQAKQESLRK